MSLRATAKVQRHVDVTTTDFSQGGTRFDINLIVDEGDEKKQKCT